MFLTTKDQAAIDKLAEKEQTVAEEAEKAQAAAQQKADLEQEKIDIQLTAIHRFRDSKNALDKALSAAFKEGGKVTLTLSAHPATADEPVTIEIDLSNTELNRDHQIQSHREFIQINAMQLAGQQATLAENKIKAEHPVQHAHYLTNK